MSKTGNDYNVLVGDVLHFSNQRRANRMTYRHWSYTVTRICEKMIYVRYPGNDCECRTTWRQFNISYHEYCDTVERNGNKLTVWISDHSPVNQLQTAQWKR